jgi:hypothetical protein
MNIFSKVSGLDPTQIARVQAQNKSVLDFITGGLTGLRPRLPASQVPKIDASNNHCDLENLNSAGNMEHASAYHAGAATRHGGSMSKLDTEHYASSLQHADHQDDVPGDLTRSLRSRSAGNSAIAANVLVAGLVDQYKDTASGIITDTEATTTSPTTAAPASRGQHHRQGLLRHRREAARG